MAKFGEIISMEPEYEYIYQDEDGNIIPVYYQYEEEGSENHTEYQYIDGLKDCEILEGGYVVEEFNEPYIYENPNQLQQEHEQVSQEILGTHIDEVINVVARGSYVYDQTKKKKGPTTKVCEFCGIVVKHPSKIEAHMRTHTGERPYVCVHCGKTFTQRTPWKSHVKRHVGDTPYKCSFCAKAFPNPSTCKAHEKRVHLKKTNVLLTPTEVNEDQAQTSGEVAEKSINNYKHKSFQCEFCNILFSSSSTYNVHIKRFHSTKKPYSCRFECGKIFPTQSNRNEHEKIVHHKIKRYQCCINNCNKLFTRRLYLSNHFTKCHSDWETIPEEIKGYRVVAVPYVEGEEQPSEASNSKPTTIVTHSDGTKYVVEIMGPFGQPPFRDATLVEDEYINFCSVNNGDFEETSQTLDPQNEVIIQLDQELDDEICY